ncbi:hydrogenase maturation nickel metallochaperone HypA [Corynebacterium sp. 153RC1]|uniref:hydrogenase maturation nickel metallochaperone HypA/HybF n=1 Tax=unclassified Corynebacterium TaxID=2624378 RepID=UPI00211BE5BE|nr:MULTISPECIES: hydrogenase maturation nickel metallochaperone HypA [unclassified Corynebacterium]MCQ9370713.1 hydrogenase maturation nickel metallochaperone HypA [Corynebacterium sp. 35RC1]MCQ9352645.1 hydrogenase maturation nickel metallochaperone HypA [Corynebacterium sp. 209RC1]MCQ9354829.1 hydrogenase maturation nickel metallochaperone HypA [Corynebacterium sp. 1222RC1]MCQ9357014.1 hydrogenase maturation nickel metallochaperone HypA [Corynebacterium sp. 122RC1]MCQ9359097.1 hydrogenase ma
MHELSLLTGVVQAVSTQDATQEALRIGATVEAVGLKVGRRSGVVIEALTAAWPIASSGTCCEDARLEIEDVPATIWCANCVAEQEIDEFFALLCPVCGHPTAEMRQGKEFALTWIEISSGEPSQPAAPQSAT